MIATCYLVVILDTTVVNVALPQIQAALHFSGTLGMSALVYGFIRPAADHAVGGRVTRPRRARHRVRQCQPKRHRPAHRHLGRRRTPGLHHGLTSAFAAGTAFTVCALAVANLVVRPLAHPAAAR
jgi:MFS family permease